MSKRNNNRIDLIDALRGVCILLMVAFHFGYDLVHYAGAPQSLIYNPLLEVLQPFFAGVFILLSGISCRFSRSNARRGVQMLAAGIVVTIVTWYMDNPAWFGILHFLGVAALLFAAYEFAHKQITLRRNAKRNAPGGASAIGIVGSADGPTVIAYSDGTCIQLSGEDAAFVHHRNIRRIIFLITCAVLFTVYYAFFYLRAYDVRGLFWLGFRSVDFHSSDYFPVFPWIFIYAMGACLGLYVTERRLPQRFYTMRVPFFAAAGRNTLWIYLAHQPVLYGVTLLIVHLTQNA